MRLGPIPHRWNISPAEAIAVQKRLASRVSCEASDVDLNLVAGADAAFSADGRHCIAGVVIWDVRERRAIESRVAIEELQFPYVPGLLTFREAPALLAAIRRLDRTPDAFLFDGQGFAHPRRFGLASHMGVLIDLPAAGCGKSRLIGEHREPGDRRGCRRPLRHDGERIGTVLRTRDGVRPVYVSVGHRMSLDQCVRLVLRCGNGYRLPEPTRLADRLVARVKRGEKVPEMAH